MCGIVAVYAFERERPVSADRVTVQTETLRHRGPAGGGVWVSDGVGLGHRRSSLVDAAGGVEPMFDKAGRYAIVFDGTIYNGRELFDELGTLGAPSATKSDAELLLLAYSVWGEACLDRLNGVFAFAIYDREKHELFAARDRLGQKPLYYYADDARVLLGSEPRAIVADPMVPRTIDATAVADYFALSYVPAPKSIYRQIFKLPAGWLLRCKSGRMQTAQYWDVDLRDPDESTAIDVHAEALRSLIADSILLRLPPSGPDDAFLLQETWSDDAISIAEELSYFFDEPFGDLTAAPSYLLCQKTSQRANVSLSAEGAAETFVARAHEVERGPALGVRDRLRALSAPLRRLLSGVAVDRDRARYESLPSVPERYRQLLSKDLLDPLGDYDPYEAMAIHYARSGSADPVARVLYAGIKSFLCDDMLVKLDRASTAHALEVRCPLLDHRVIEYAARIPSRHKQGGNLSKKVLGQASEPTRSIEVFARARADFRVPLADALRGERRRSVESHLFRAKTSRILGGAMLERIWREHQTGAADHGAALWRALMFELWYARAFGDERREPTATLPMRAARPTVPISAPKQYAPGRPEA